MSAKSLLVSDVVPGESPRELLLEDGVSFLAGEDVASGPSSWQSLWSTGRSVLQGVVQLFGIQLYKVNYTTIVILSYTLHVAIEDSKKILHQVSSIWLHLPTAFPLCHLHFHHFRYSPLSLHPIALSNIVQYKRQDHLSSFVKNGGFMP